MDNLTIVILAAGLGTRMKSKKAKVLHEAGGKALIEHVVGAALEIVPPQRVFVVVGRQAEEVQQAVAGRGAQFVVQREQLGTGHALTACRESVARLKGDVAVLYGDCPLLRAGAIRRLVETQRGGKSAATVITTVLEDPSGYGRVLRDEDGSVRAIVEQKAATEEQLALREINSGIYCFRGDLLWRHLGQIEPNNPAREYYLTDIVEIFRRAGYSVQPLLIEDSSELLGINTRVELAQVDAVFRLRKARQLMLDGVTIERPETVTVDAEVAVGPDTVIEPFVRLLGRTRIGENCRVGACSILRDTTLADEVEVRPFTSIDDCTVGRGARVGPYARLRMKAAVGAGALIGNFVELKKTELGAGSKAQHLAYLGDAKIGENANIGAGTITCNYDGRKKHETRIGDRCFIGSNATLIAPLEIGEGAYVAGGSVITDPVPPGSLALGRGRQVVKEGWVKNRAADARK
jgi:bifunctional UDP-N-acetylglucosamine pyrophosphorylase/glucosamine-1-phosphate N-acetyltransferase